MIEVDVKGVPDVRAELSAIPEKLRRRALRNALAAGARIVRDSAKRSAPTIPITSLAVRQGKRKPGTLRGAISVRTSKLARRRGDVGVFVNVKPAKGSKRGKDNPDDPYYWRWVEFGTKFARPSPFLQSAASKLSDALGVFIKNIRPAIAKLNKPKAPAP